jgi:hypothetical protein
MDVVQDVLGILSGAEHVASYEFLPPEHFWTEDALITLCGELWHSQRWTEDGLCRMSYQEDDDEEPGTDVGLAMEDIDVAATDLDYLMPQSCSLWHWEDYGLPELVSGELEHFLRTHSENAARRHSTASTEIEEWMRCAWRVETRRSPGGPRSTSRDNFVY